MIFGNWKITNDSIVWNGGGLNRFKIPAKELNKLRSGKDDTSKFYDWIFVATDEDWLTENDLYDLNFAFVYAIAKFNLEFDYEIFDHTLERQYELFEDEDDEDFQ